MKEEMMGLMELMGLMGRMGNVGRMGVVGSICPIKPINPIKPTKPTKPIKPTKPTKPIKPILIFTLTLAFFLPSFAQHQMTEVYVMVNLKQDGSADVTERRTAVMGEQGTEGFITFNNMGDIGVTNLRVGDETGTEYEVEEQWDVNRSREEKTGKCGYHKTDQGVELCWGIGAAGERVYYIYYTLTNLVKSYEDYDGFCHSFYEAANTPADKAIVTIRVEGDSLTKKNSRIWTFGFAGYKGHASSGFLFATSDSLMMREGDAIIVLLELEKGVLQPAVKKKGTFKELVKRPAFVDSEYDVDVAMGDTLGIKTGRSSLLGGEVGTGHEPHQTGFAAKDEGGRSWELIIMFLLVVGLILWAASGVIKDDWQRKKRAKASYRRLAEKMGCERWEEAPYWRALPMQGGLLASGVVLASVTQILKEANRPFPGMVQMSIQHLYEALIMRMFYRGGIQFGSDLDQKGNARKLFRISQPVRPAKQPAKDVVGLAGSYKVHAHLLGNRLSLVRAQYQGMMNDEGMLYALQDMLYKAAGEDHLLQPDELRQYVNQHMEELRPMADALHILLTEREMDAQLAADDVQQVTGFLRFLRDFSLVNERCLEEVALWKEYLVFATFYGIAQQVRRDMKKVAPDVTQLDQLIPPQQVIEHLAPMTTALVTCYEKTRRYQTAYEIEQARKSYSSSSDYSPRSHSSSSGSSGRSSYSGGGGHSGGGGSGFR